MESTFCGIPSGIGVFPRSGHEAGQAAIYCCEHILQQGSGARLKEYRKETSVVLGEQGTSGGGLSGREASARLARCGPNRLREAPRSPLLRRVLGELKNPMVVILLVAALVSGVAAVYAGESFADVVIILVVVVINAVLGVVQESKAERAIEALRAGAAFTSRVLRDGWPQVVRSEELVPGDIVLLEAGDAVPADGRIIESANLQLEEAALTGESVPVTKRSGALRGSEERDVPLGDRVNMCYMGSMVVNGRGRAVITATGMETEMGKIAGALAAPVERETPLQHKMNQLSQTLSVLVVGICALIFAVDIFRAWPAVGGAELLDTFMVAVSLAVAAIPEGLAAVVTIVLSVGVTNMSKRHAVIRRLTAVETLGCTQVICSDKTGTLTQNKMTVTAHSAADEAQLATAMSLCSDAEPGEGGRAVGEPTECALVDYAAGLGLPKSELKRRYPRVGEVPFDSGRKMMTTLHRDGAGGFRQFTKGAPDEVLRRCTSVMTAAGPVPLTPERRRAILAENGRMAGGALRVLLAAMRPHASMPGSLTAGALETELCYLGLCGMMDPVRPEVRPAIESCREAGCVHGFYQVNAGVDAHFVQHMNNVF